MESVEIMTRNVSPPARPEDGRLRWRSRRGMLELELALAPFLEQRLATLDSDDRQRYARLLEQDDWDILEWLQGRGVPADADLAAIVGQIQAANPGL